MMINNFEQFTYEIRKIGNLVKQNKKNSEWINIVNAEKNTTAGDYKIDKLLKNTLIQFGKDVPYFSEEHIHTIHDRPEEYWLADPIDGTSSWMNGFDGYVIQAALIKNKKPLFSFIYWPEKNSFYHCFKDKGPYLNNKKIVNHRKNNKIIIVDNYPEPRGDIVQLLNKFNDLDYLEMGSLGLKCLLVAVGTCDLFIKTTKFRDWDILSAKLFIDESNFKILNLDRTDIKFGSQIEFNKGLLVYNPIKINETMLDFIKCMEKNFEK